MGSMIVRGSLLDQLLFGSLCLLVPACVVGPSAPGSEKTSRSQLRSPSQGRLCKDRHRLCRGLQTSLRGLSSRLPGLPLADERHECVCGSQDRLHLRANRRYLDKPGRCVHEGRIRLYRLHRRRVRLPQLNQSLPTGRFGSSTGFRPFLPPRVEDG
jgi:hypothetical protein